MWGRTKTKEKRAQNGIRDQMASALLILALGCFSFLVFISPFLGALGICLSLFSGLAYMEVSRRRHWENRFSFRLKKVETQSANLSGAVEKNSRDIRSLNAENLKISRNLDDAHEAETKAALLSLDTIPSAILPQSETLEKKTSPLIANDDPFSEHASLSDVVVQELVHQAIRKERIEIFMQPIVRLPQRKAVAYELFARIRAKPGLYVPAARYMKAARKDRLESEIDVLLLERALDTIKATAAKNRIEDGCVFFINIDPKTLKHKRYIRTLLTFLAKNRNLARHLVFEMAQEDFANLKPDMHKLLQALGQLGCSFSLDHVETMHFDIERYLAANIAYLKVSAESLLTRGNDEYAFSHFRKQKRTLERNGIRVIVERVESEAAIRQLLDYDLRYGQGFIFGKPDLQGAYSPFAFTRQNVKRVGEIERFG